MAYHRATFSLGSVTGIDAATPAQTTDIAVVQGITLELKGTSVPLRGTDLLPIDEALSEVEITGKIESADSIALIAPLILPGTTTATGRPRMALETSTIPGTPFQITVSHSADFRKDLGVVNLTTGKRMKRVTSSPAAGQYSVAAGVYTFASAEGSARIRYSWTDSTTGISTTWLNQAVGSTAAYQLEVYDPTGGTREFGYYLPAVRFTASSGSLNPREWNKTSLDFTAFAASDGTGFVIWSDE